MSFIKKYSRCLLVGVISICIVLASLSFVSMAETTQYVYDIPLSTVISGYSLSYAQGTGSSRPTSYTLYDDYFIGWSYVSDISGYRAILGETIAITGDLFWCDNSFDVPCSISYPDDYNTVVVNLRVGFNKGNASVQSTVESSVKVGNKSIPASAYVVNTSQTGSAQYQLIYDISSNSSIPVSNPISNISFDIYQAFNSGLTRNQAYTVYLESFSVIVTVEDWVAASYNIAQGIDSSQAGKAVISIESALTDQTKETVISDFQSDVDSYDDYVNTLITDYGIDTIDIDSSSLADFSDTAASSPFWTSFYSKFISGTIVESWWSMVLYICFIGMLLSLSAGVIRRLKSPHSGGD